MDWAAHGVTWKKGGVRMDLKWNAEALKILQTLPQEIAEEVGRQIAAEAQARAPIKTGALKTGIKMHIYKRGVFVRVRPAPKLHAVSAFKGRIKFKNLETLAGKWRRTVYPVWVEFGTQYMGARPFLRPAKALVERRLPQIARGKFRQVL